MNLISLDGVGRALGDRVLFESVSLGIDSGDRIALIGVNGSGKSTFLRIIHGSEQPDSGSVSKNRDLTMSFLEQTPQFEPSDTILDHIFKNNNPKTALIKRYEEACAAMSEGHSEARQDALDSAVAEMDRLGAWQYETDVRAVLDRLGISDLKMKMGSLSGGMLKKVALAHVLIEDSGVLLLDEPTNHLDIDTIEWLQNYLQKTPRTVVMVTHDRYFLDGVCKKIYEIDMRRVLEYYGNYSYYLQKKAEMREGEIRSEERMKSILRVELEWLGRGPKARGTKQKARIDRIEDMRSREVRRDEDFELSVSGRRLGKKILSVKNITKSFDGRVVVKPFTHSFKRMERIGVIGPNGSGKTTFLNMITSRLAPDAGEIDKGINTHFGYFDQTSSPLDPDTKVIDFAKKSGDMLELADGHTIHVTAMLERFLFPKESHYTAIRKLSGGERRRLYLLSVLMENPNFLVFDEPTNDFDVKTLSVLEDFLNEYSGCLVVVSHDRYFMDRVVDYMFVFDGSGNIKGFPGNFSDYMQVREAFTAQAMADNDQLQPKKPSKPEEPAAQAGDGGAQPKKKKLSFNEQREYDRIEDEIAALEAEKVELESLIGSGEIDHKKLTAWLSRQKELDGLIEEKMARWEYLASIAESGQA